MPLKIKGMHFSILDSRVLGCLGAEKYRMYPRFRPGVSE